MARKTRLTPEIIDAIAERIRQGTFPYIAAQSVGVARSTFYDWMGRGESGRTPFSELLDKVREASAAARHDAEARVFQEKPLEWLRLGPGRSKPNEPGWTDTMVLAGDPERPIEHHHQHGSYLVLDEAETAETLEELEKAGIIQINRAGTNGVEQDSGRASSADGGKERG